MNHPVSVEITHNTFSSLSHEKPKESLASFVILMEKEEFELLLWMP